MSLHHLKPHSYVRQSPSFPPLFQSKSSQLTKFLGHLGSILDIIYHTGILNINNVTLYIIPGILNKMYFQLLPRVFYSRVPITRPLAFWFKKIINLLL